MPPLPQAVKIKTVKKGTNTFTEIEYLDIIFINTGLVRSYICDSKGKEFTFELYYNAPESTIGNFFVVDFPSLLTQTPSRRTYEVLVDTEVFSLSKEGLDMAYKTSKKWERMGRIMTEQAYLFLNSVFQSNMIKSAKQRYIELIDSAPTLINEIPQYHCASFLGITPESLSRIKKEIENGK